MADISALVGELSGITDQKLKLERYMAVLQDYVSQAAIPQLQAFVQHVVSEDVQLAVSRPVVLELAKSMSSLALEQRKEIGLFTLDKIGLRVVSFEEQVSVIREELATIYEKEEKWSEAAKMLAGIPLDSGIRVLDDNYKVQKYIKIAQLFLEDDEPVSAEGSINRASLLITEETEPSLRLLHKARSPLPLRPVPSPPSRRLPPPCCVGPDHYTHCCFVYNSFLTSTTHTTAPGIPISLPTIERKLKELDEHVSQELIQIETILPVTSLAKDWT